MSELKSIGEKIAELRKSLKLQQDEFADRLGVSRQALSLWETGRQVPRADKIADICDLFGIDGSYFYSKEELEIAKIEQDEPPMPEENQDSDVKTEEEPEQEEPVVQTTETKEEHIPWWRKHWSGLFDLIFGWFWILVGFAISIVLIVIEISPNINDTTVRVWMIDWLAVAIILFIFILGCTVFYVVKTIAYVGEVMREKKS